MAEQAGLPDVQARATDETAEIAIARAGISGLQIPVAFADANGSVQHTVATASAWAAVPPGQRGAHMSRLPAEIENLRERLALAELADFVTGLAQTMDADAAGVELRFPIFLDRKAPLSSKAGSLDCSAIVRIDYPRLRLQLRLSVPVTMLCPCSKEISARGAHSQRASLELQAHVAGSPPSLYALAQRIERHASAQIFSVLKRADEKAVTEQAYDHPRFAEDAVRLLAADVAQDAEFSSWQVRAVNHESIHNHDVFALVRSSDLEN